MHTRWSHDCSIEPSELIDHAEEIGLGAIAVTDHNVFGGALETAELARGRDLVVVKAEEVKTDGQGEVIGLFLSEEIPRGMSFADTIAAIREQEGVVYLPHPFDRMHAIPDPATLHRHVADIDVFEVYNARLLRESFNDEALRFARKYRLLQGAGSDAHVLQGVGTGALRMRRFDGPEEFLLSLRTAEVLAPPEVARLPPVAQVGRAGTRQARRTAVAALSVAPAPETAGAVRPLLQLDSPLERVAEQADQLFDRPQRLSPLGGHAAGSVRLQRVVQRIDDVVHVKRLRHVRHRTGLDDPLDQRARPAGERDDRDVLLGEDAARHLDAVEPRQPQVEQDHVGCVLACELDGL